MDNLITVMGSCDFLVKEKIDELLNALEANDDNYTVYDLEENSFLEMIEDLNTFPFFGDKKIILANNPVFLEENSGYDDLINYLKKPLETSYLIINASNIKWSKQNKYCKALELYTRIIEIKDAESKKDYALMYLKKNQTTIDDNALEELLNRVSDVNLLCNEIDKLSLYKDHHNICLEDVCLLVSKSIEDDVYELSTAFLENNKKRAFEIYQNLIAHNEDSIGIMNVLIRKFIEILNTKLLVNKKATKEDVAKYFNVSLGRAYYMIKAAKNISLDDLKKSIDNISKLDFDIKAGNIDKNLGLEMFLLR